MQELVYPLVQITMGSATLMPSAAFFPFRLHCASLLIALSRQTKVYIPVAALLLEVGACVRACSTRVAPDVRIHTNK